MQLFEALVGRGRGRGWPTCAVVAEHDGGQQQERLLAGQEVVGGQLPRHLPRLPRLHVVDALLQQAGGLLPPARPGGPQHAQQAVPEQVQVQVQVTGTGLQLTWCPAPAASARCSLARGAGCPWRPRAGASGWPPQPPSCSPQGLGWRPLAALHLAALHRAALHLAAPCSVSTSWPPSWPAAAWWRGGRTCNITQLLLLSAVPCATSPAAPGAWRGISWPQPAPARSSSTGPCRTGVDIDIM